MNLLRLFRQCSLFDNYSIILRKRDQICLTEIEFLHALPPNIYFDFAGPTAMFEFIPVFCFEYISPVSPCTSVSACQRSANVIVLMCASLLRKSRQTFLKRRQSGNWCKWRNDNIFPVVTVLVKRLVTRLRMTTDRKLSFALFLNRSDGYPGLVNRKLSTTEVFFGLMVTIEFFYGLVIKQMLFLNKNYENFPFYNAEIHVYRFRALS